MTNKKDLTGQTFERLTVMEPVSKQRWRCKCECGNEIVVYGYNLLRGHNKSCGCLKFGKKKQLYIRPHVFKHLEEFGNTVLSKRVYAKLGEKEVLRQLKERGFDCTIEVVIHSEYKEDDKFTYDEWKSVIIRVKEECR